MTYPDPNRPSTQATKRRTALLPEEITVFGVTLKKRDYLTLAGLVLLILIIGLSVYATRRWVRKELNAYFEGD